MKPSPDIIGAVIFDGYVVNVYEGDTLGACLMRAGVLTIRRSISGEPRGMFCGIGVCNECLVTVDGVRNVRACVNKARPGAVIQITDSKI